MTTWRGRNIATLDARETRLALNDAISLLASQAIAARNDHAASLFVAGVVVGTALAAIGFFVGARLI